jgi:hypothetical protein
VSDVLQQIKARIRPLQASDLISELLGPHREDALRGNLPVVLFCAGSSGRILCPFLIQGGIRPACFCDNDPGRVGQSIDGVPVIAFEELERTHRESLVIIASAAYQHGIRRQLLDAGFHAGNVITLDSPSSEFEAQVRRESLLMLARNGEPGQVMEELEPQAEALQRAYDLLADEKSKALFVQRLALVASGYEYRAYREYLETFSEPLLRFQSGDPRRWSVSSAFFYLCCACGRTRSTWMVAPSRGIRRISSSRPAKRRESATATSTASNRMRATTGNCGPTPPRAGISPA